MCIAYTPYVDTFRLRNALDFSIPFFGPVARFKYQPAPPVIHPEIKVIGFECIRWIKQIIQAITIRRKGIGYPDKATFKHMNFFTDYIHASIASHYFE